MRIYSVPFLLCFLAATCFLTVPARTQPTSDEFPESHMDLKKPLSYAALEKLLADAASRDFIDVTVEGQSTQGRNLYLVNLNRGGEEANWRVFFVGIQHGDEPAGKDALMYLIRAIMKDPDRLPENVDLWIMPMVNPDGSEAGQRRNGAGQDLNRDHLLLTQPETQAIHRVHRRIMPHVSVDCHEATRDTGDYVDQGWIEWPQIMMDTANNVLFGETVYQSGTEWIAAAEIAMKERGHNFARYVVGAAPPEGEMRHSTFECDDARNGLGMYGNLSFIIESGVFRSTRPSDEDLFKRVDAYLGLFEMFLNPVERRRSRYVKVVELAREAPLPAFLPVNTFWGNVGQHVEEVAVIDADTGETLRIPMANFMRHRIVKRSVPTPQAYVINPDSAEPFKALLGRHAIPYETVEADDRVVTVEDCELVRIEETTDEVYNRYGGRQIVERREARPMALKPGAMLVRLDGEARVRAAIVLEPCNFYGLYQFDEFRDLVAEDGTLPVARIMRGL